MRAPAVADDVHLVAGSHRGGRAAFEQRRAQIAQRLHQPEAARLVVGERMAGDDYAGVGGEPDRLRLGDQVAYGEHESVLADHHAVAQAFGTEYAAGERILGYFGAQQNHRVQHLIEIEIEFLGTRLQGFVKSPWFHVGHDARFCHVAGLLAGLAWRRPAGAGSRFSQTAIRVLPLTPSRRRRRARGLRNDSVAPVGAPVSTALCRA